MAGLDLAPPRPFTKKQKRLNRLKFPGCIGMFEDDCKGVTEKKPGSFCKGCPYYKK